VGGSLLQHVLKCVVWCVAVPVVAPVPCGSVRGGRLTLVESAAVEVFANRVSSGQIVGVHVDVGELQNFQGWRARLRNFNPVLIICYLFGRKLTSGS